MRVTLLGGLALLALIGATACTPGTVLGARAKCSGSAALVTQVSGDCERMIENLSKADTQHIAVQTSDVAPFATIDFTVSVESGKVGVSFVDSQGDPQTAEASPGSPASGSVRVRLDPLNQIKFDLAPVGGEARGVNYRIKFVCDCLP